MKAIHNAWRKTSICDMTVFNTTNIQNESNSQQDLAITLYSKYCIQYYKYTK